MKYTLQPLKKDHRRVHIIGIVGVPACYGGFETLVENILQNDTGNNVYTVYCSGKAYRKEARLHRYHKARLRYLPIAANGLSSIFYDALGCFSSLQSDVVLILGVSGAILLPLFRLLYKGKIIINIDGLEWKREKWPLLAKRFLLLSEKIAVLCSDVVVGDNKVIIQYIKKTYNKKAELIEYGGDCIESSEGLSQLFHKYPFVRKKYAVSVCRIVPENNIELILTAFSQIENMECVFIGNWDSSPYGRRLRKAYSSFANLILLDPIYEKHEINGLRKHAYVYLHGHSAGGTNPSLVEAMYLGLPVLAYDCEYNRETTEEKAIYFKTSTDIVECLTNDKGDKIKNIGAIQHEIASRRYRWKKISSKYTQLY